MGLQRSLILILAMAASLLSQSTPECVSCVDDCLAPGCELGTDCDSTSECILDCASDALTSTTCETSDLVSLLSCGLVNNVEIEDSTEVVDCVIGAVENADAECGVCLLGTIQGLENGDEGLQKGVHEGQLPCMEPTNFEGCSINTILPVFNKCKNTECFLDKVGNFTDADCGQCLLAFIGYVDLVGVDNYPATLNAITDFCIDGLGPPELMILPFRKLEASNVCSGTETDLETVSLTILEIFDGTFPTEAIVPPYTPAPTAAPSAAPTVTTGTTTTGTTTTGTTTGTSTTTTGTTSTTGTSSAVHLRSISSLFLLVVASAGIWA